MIRLHKEGNVVKKWWVEFPTSLNLTAFIWKARDKKSPVMTSLMHLVCSCWQMFSCLLLHSTQEHECVGIHLS